MTTYANWEQIRELMRLSEENGFMVKQSKHHYDQRLFGLFAAGGTFTEEDNCLPLYSRDAELYAGTAEDLICYLRGWMRSREYLKMLMPKTVNDTKIKHWEDVYRQEATLRMLKNGKSET